MRILYIHQYFTLPTESGGTRSYEMAKSLIAHGHRVTMVCGTTKGWFDGLKPTRKKNVRRGVKEGIDIIQILAAYSNSMGLFARTKSFLTFAMHSVGFALKENYDLLFATSTPLTAGIPGIVMKMFRRKKFVFEVRDLWPALPKALGMKNPFWIGCMSVLEWLSYHCADGCVGLSPGICEGIKKRSQKGKPIIMVPNGCDLDLFNPSQRGEFKMEGISPTDKTAIFTGAHGVANGLDAVLDAAKVVQERGRKDIKIVFLGEGKIKPHLQERAKNERIDNCIFHKPIPKIQIPQIVCSATVGLMVLKNVPAFYYGTSPNKFFDYIAGGLPVLTNYPGWIADMIKRDRFGEVVEPDNAEAFADAIIRMVDSERLSEYGGAARALAEREFGRKELGVKLVKFLEGLANC